MSSGGISISASGRYSDVPLRDPFDLRPTDGTLVARQQVSRVAVFRAVGADPFGPEVGVERVQRIKRIRPVVHHIHSVYATTDMPAVKAPPSDPGRFSEPELPTWIRPSAYIGVVRTEKPDYDAYGLDEAGPSEIYVNGLARSSVRSVWLVDEASHTDIVHKIREVTPAQEDIVIWPFERSQATAFAR